MYLGLNEHVINYVSSFFFGSILNSEEIPIAEIVLSSAAALLPHPAKVHLAFTQSGDSLCFKLEEQCFGFMSEHHLLGPLDSPF